MDEFTALAYHRTKNLDVVIARLFNAIGPNQTGAYGMVVPRFVGQALANEPLTVHGDGTQTRTFTCVKDVVRAMIGLMEAQNTTGEVFNIGGKQEITILELAQKIIEITESSSTIELIPYEKAFGKDFEDMMRRLPSTAKLKQYIGFAPNNDLDHMLRNVIDHVKKQENPAA
jgi:UDP-glucose 4-epimerase